MMRPLYRQLHLTCKAIERVEGRRVEEIGLAESLFKAVLEELSLDHDCKKFLLNGVRVVESFDELVSFILADRAAADAAIARAKAATVAETAAAEAAPHEHKWRKDARRGATGRVCDCGATR